MADEPSRRAEELIVRLHQRGHHAEAERLARDVSPHGVGQGLLFALREACETVLTAIEAIDPVTQTMIEELRLEVETHLRAHPAGNAR